MKLLCFHAKWCGQCRKQLKEFEELENVPITFVEIMSGEKSMILSRAFDVRDVPTTIVLQDSFDIDNTNTWKKAEVQKLIDFVSAEDIKSLL